MRYRQFFAVWLAAGALVAACSSFSGSTSEPGPTDAATPSADVSAPTVMEAGASTDADGDSGSDDAGENLYPNGSFENGIGTWVGFQGDVAPSNEAHSGGHSLRVCQGGGGFATYTGDDKGVFGPVEAGTTYRVSAWFRTTSSKSPPGNAVLHLRTQQGGNNKEVGPTGAVSPPTDTWQQAFASINVTKPNDDLNVYVEGVSEPDGGTCFLVDDVVLTKD